MSTVSRGDPVAFELIKNALAGIADGMAVTVVRTARSFVVKQTMDFSTGLCTASGELVAQGLCTPLHLGSMPPALAAVIRHYGDQFQPGDIYGLNDPYEGGSHLPDIFLFKPVFAKGTLMGFVNCIAHQTDIGGRVAGGNACDNTEIYQEGLRIPPLKFYEADVPNDMLFKMIEKNVRVPDKVLGDIRAQVAALYSGERELLKLASEYGVEELQGYMNEILDYSERFTRQQIQAFPDGEYEFTEWVDDDGITTDPIRIQVKVIIHGDSITVDFTGTSPQCRGSIQPNITATMAMTYAAVRCVLDPAIPNNGGYFRPIQVIAPEGTFVNPMHPAPVAARSLGARRVAQGIFGALTKALPGRIFAAWGGGEFGISIGGYYADRRPFVHLEFHNETSWGGGPYKDGLDAHPGPMSNLANTPVELLEVEQPIRIDRYEFLPDTGGAGRYRGGLSQVRDFHILADEATLQVRSDRRKFPPYGLYGGKPGTLADGFLNPHEENRQMPSKFIMTAGKHDVFRMVTAGGGGYGDPLEREPHRVLDDVSEEKLTVEHARQEYGVVIDPQNLTVNHRATEALRQEMRQAAPGKA